MLSLRARLSSSYVWIIIVCIILVGILSNFFLERQFRHYIEQTIENRNRQLVASITQQFKGHTWNQLTLSNIGMNALEQGLFLKVEDREGRELWNAFRHNNGLCQQMMAHMSQNMLSRYPNWKGIYTEKKYPIQTGGRTIGAVFVGYYGPFYYNDTELSFINTLNRILLGVLLVALVVALITGTVISKRISSPITRVIETAREMSGGNLAARSNECTDIREINQLIGSINDLGATLEKQEILRKRLTADVAHELRTPLATVQSHLEAMIDGVWELDRARLEGCHEEIVRLTRMVKDLERLAKHDKEQLVLEKTQFDLAVLLRQITENLQADFVSRGVSLHFQGKTTIVDADRDKLTQVVINLLSNSLKYTPGGGKVIIWVREGAGFAMIGVEDTGIGIAPEDLPYIFERFYRADQSRNRLTGGSGIGLTIAKSIVEAHHGEIQVESTKGKGTRILVRLPLVENF